MLLTMGEPGRDDYGGAWRETLEGLVRTVRRTVDLQSRVAKGSARATDIGSAYVRFLRSDLAAYGRTVAELTVDYYRALAEAAREYGERFYDEVRTGGGHEPPETVEEPTRHSIDLAGPIGDEIAASFTLENNDPTPAEVSIETGVCRGPDGEVFAAPLTVEPERVVISPGESVAVTLRARLTEDEFVPGVEYRMPVYVNGPRPATIQVRLRAETTLQPAPTGAKEGFRVHCPKCRRTFERKTEDLRLRPHKTPDGAACPERQGRRAG